MQKIILIGSPASGKTTLARTLHEKLHFPLHHLDKHFWKENWTPIPQEDFIKLQSEFMREPQWIIEGNFTKTIARRAAEADTIVLFDLPKRVIAWRWLKRYIRDLNKSTSDMGGGNKILLPKLWSIKFMINFPIAEIYKILEPLKDKKNIVIIRNSKDAEAFLKTVSVG